MEGTQGQQHPSFIQDVKANMLSKERPNAFEAYCAALSLQLLLPLTSIAMKYSSVAEVRPNNATSAFNNTMIRAHS
jgi:hypothetical protein